jgi:hypothetical protein
VSAGLAYLPGLRVASDAVVTVNHAANGGSTDRMDYVVLRANWSTNTCDVFVVQGTSPSPPALTETEGTTWHMPLARVNVRPGVTAIAGSDIEICKPLPRALVRRFTGSVNTATRTPSSSVFTVGTINVDDPGWPYLLDCEGAARFAANSGNGQAVLEIWVNGSLLQAAMSPTLDVYHPVQVSTASAVLTGKATVELRIRPSQMSSGSLVLASSVHSKFLVKQMAG